ncbi:thioredoxin family protein [Candidatus Curtissbacteria bacterium]|nr:thioredoxin family protein [Candidatus Curtissbacteria bacterium]
MKNPLILIIPAVLIIGGIVIFFVVRGISQEQKSTVAQTAQQSPRTIQGYQGVVLAGSSSPYLEFNKTDYQKALFEKKIIILDFYANWCPICRAETPHLRAGFDSLTSEQVVGFRVNFNDSDTDNDEKELAKEFEIPYQHTKVILKNGQEVKRSGDQWDEETFEREIQPVL